MVGGDSAELADHVYGFLSEIEDGFHRYIYDIEEVAEVIRRYPLLDIDEAERTLPSVVGPDCGEGSWCPTFPHMVTAYRDVDTRETVLAIGTWLESHLGWDVFVRVAIRRGANLAGEPVAWDVVPCLMRIEVVGDSLVKGPPWTTWLPYMHPEKEQHEFDRAITLCKSGSRAGARVCLTFAHAVALLGCVNVKSVKRRTPKRVAKHARRMGAIESDHYHVLALPVGPVPDTARRDPGEAPDARAKRLHVARGHFATYTEENPLFGRHVGRFWKPAHVRGAAGAGVVSKDYRLGRP